MPVAVDGGGVSECRVGVAEWTRDQVEAADIDRAATRGGAQQADRGQGRGVADFRFHGHP